MSTKCTTWLLFGTLLFATGCGQAAGGNNAAGEVGGGIASQGQSSPANTTISGKGRTGRLPGSHPYGHTMNGTDTGYGPSHDDDIPMRQY